MENLYTNENLLIIIGVLILVFLGLITVILYFIKKIRKIEVALSYSITKNDIVNNARLDLDDNFFYKKIDEEDKGKTISIEDIENKHKDYTAIKNQIKLVLGHWENMALAIYRGVADEKTAYEMVASTLLSHVECLNEYIKFRKNQNPEAYKYLMMLYLRWKGIKDNLHK